MPSNSVWLLAQALKPAAAVADATPFGGDSVRDPGEACTGGRRACSGSRRARPGSSAGVQGSRCLRSPGQRAWSRPNDGGGARDESGREAARGRLRRPPTSSCGETLGRRGGCSRGSKEIQHENDEEIEGAHVHAERAEERAEEPVETGTGAPAEAKRLADERRRPPAPRPRRPIARRSSSPTKRISKPAMRNTDRGDRGFPEHLTAAARHAARELIGTRRTAA